MDEFTRIEVLNAMAHHESTARKAYAAGDLEAGHKAARLYHDVADYLLEQTGIEYRPEE